MNNECKGLVFRAYVTDYVNRYGEFIHTERLRLMKRQSCRCQSCQIQFDCYLESINIGLMPIIDDPLIDKGLYGLKIVNESRDWETGVIDDYDYKFIHIN